MSTPLPPTTGLGELQQFALASSQGSMLLPSSPALAAAHQSGQTGLLTADGLQETWPCTC